MGIPSFFRQNKPKEFKYVPRYYDPEKEEQEERLRRIREEMGISADGEKRFSTIQRGSFNQKFRHKQQKARRNSSLRIVLIFLVLSLLVYLYWRL